MKLSKEEAEVFYSEHKDKFFFKRLVNYMTCGPLMACILYKEDCLAAWRKLMGGTKVYKTIYEDPLSIRGRFGLTDTRNSTHGSDSEESALREMAFFFKDFDAHAWIRSPERPKFERGEVVFNEKEFIHVPLT